MSYDIKPRVRCCDCVYFIPDKIGSGLGIGDSGALGVLLANLEALSQAGIAA